MIPDWLHILSWFFLTLGGLCALWIAGDEAREPQPMWIMNLVWPVVALFGGPLALCLYMRGRKAAHMKHPHGAMHHESSPMPVAVAKAAAHCGSSCTLGDIVAETLVFFVPGVAVWFGWHSIFTEKTFAVWVLDFILAFVFGIVFQYFTIVPMKKLPPGKGIVAALKADTLSLMAWQVGMYGFMAVAQFAIFRPLYNATLDAGMPEFWFTMQIAMLCGFATAYPVNWWLVRSGIKERM